MPANATKVQGRKDGTVYTQIPAYVRDDLGIRKGNLLKWTSMGPGRYQVEVTRDSGGGSGG